MNGSPLPNITAFPRAPSFPDGSVQPPASGSRKSKSGSRIRRQFHQPRLSPSQSAVKPGDAVKPEDTHPLTALTVKSVIAGPSTARHKKPGKDRIHGAAWAGEADVDESQSFHRRAAPTWNPANLGHEQAHYAWRLWNYDGKRPSPATTPSSRAPPTARAAPNPPPQRGIPAATSATPSIR